MKCLVSLKGSNFIENHCLHNKDNETMVVSQT